jgi:hypothetical protein
MKTTFMGRYNPGAGGDEDDPLSGIANLFDVMLVFAVGLLVSFLAYSGLTELLTEESVTIVKNPGTEDMTIITKDGEEIEINMITEESAEGLGEEVGKIYRLPNGETIYVPQE